MSLRTFKTLSLASLVLALAACSTTETNNTTDTNNNVTNTNGSNQVIMDPFNPASPLYQNKSVYFAFDSYTVEPEYNEMIQMHAKYLSSNPTRTVRVEGNTDLRGSSEYNLALGQRRSVAVARLLNQYGVNSAQLEAVSFGKERPQATGNSEEAHAQNRRADIQYMK
ncbi:peptidoglycan-associated lipoprotein Pal [Taylorella equigenitalis]|uniref:Peptidoglycan-associated lipoprotein n=1 Tax=Taylorella equigenitalis (strain MCE9) TaxID=937774 RepID=A0A654KHN9_TAYEM|nr:peptidoglycan-associated lipoprotein Pal [Taylorella equigenitalis]ADU91910.1 18K peptidoglycan-associated outer membrane lipoprotein [Taylorella equigenitalis MCE9]ASY40423.1 peptidoglycan-associated lipoprotein [Taylorella equigenitalis]WDU46726.1 peptidoglycan-associated lipoprotein Pal [Taylorella equigenitalis]WDU52192.1 peptidoglycan-associated lipoprotein Pal [Taylorella equigenitalis]WDU56684.1 peptidoglycan-associated lipoprotein Pal [Taylorella equigenitalis]